MKLNIKGIAKSVIAGATIIGGVILGNEARKCFTKPLPNDEELDDNDRFCEYCDDAAEETPAEEADDEPDEVPED